MTIQSATAIYTGGGIFIYYGRLQDGTFFRAVDDWDCIEICNADTSTEEADYQEFYEEHRIKTLNGEDYKAFWDEMLHWIIQNMPEGNYTLCDMLKRLRE